MPSGVELMLGFRIKDWKMVFERLGFDTVIPFYEEGAQTFEGDASVVMHFRDSIDENLNSKKLDKKLQAAHDKACKAMGWTKVEPVLVSSGDYKQYKTPAGVREFSPFSLELAYDPDEMGDRIQDAILGISLSGRYFPTFLDWKDSYGTLGTVSFDKTFMKEVAIARKYIQEVLPIFSKAVLTLKEVFY